MDILLRAKHSVSLPKVSNQSGSVCAQIFPILNTSTRELCESERSEGADHSANTSCSDMWNIGGDFGLSRTQGRQVAAKSLKACPF